MKAAEPCLVMNKTKTNWNKYLQGLGELDNLPHVGMFCTKKQLEDQATAIQDIMFDALDKASATRKRFVKAKNEWFTKELISFKDKVTGAWKLAKTTLNHETNDVDWARFKHLRDE